MKLTPREKDALAARLRDYCETELDCEMGSLQADLFVEFIAMEFAPVFYNSGLRDAQALLMKKMDDFADSIAALEMKT
ncbi:DUF2164 domain-containing protein [Martelella endophytica]|uniref:DUF2164 domain-containing protein n=1 Tax=Martelella endophytica TaxID=1486262 RepID=A0A0D5LY96_MAREN|nr:DUF2164 domain-containing protein [Martelella endophytica]AJY48423.1 hypothetical protein TM49_21405 [Martelella endophytica]